MVQTKTSTRKSTIIWLVSIAILFFMALFSPVFFGLSKVYADDSLPARYDWMNTSEKARMLANGDTRYDSFSADEKNRYNTLIAYDIPSLASPETINFMVSSTLQYYLIGISSMPATIKGMQAALLATNREGTREYLALDIKKERADAVITFLSEKEVEVAEKVVSFLAFVDVLGLKYNDSTPVSLWTFLDHEREFNRQIADNEIIMSFVNNSDATMDELNGTYVPTDTNVSSLTIKEVFDRVQTRLNQNIEKLSLWAGVDQALADEFGRAEEKNFIERLEDFEARLGQEPPIPETVPADKNRLTKFSDDVGKFKKLVIGATGHLPMLVTQDDFINAFFADILSEETLKEENIGKTNAQIKKIAGDRFVAQITSSINNIEQNLAQRIKRISNSNPFGIPGWAIFLIVLFVILVIGFAYMVHLGVLNYWKPKKPQAETEGKKGLWPFNKGKRK